MTSEPYIHPSGKLSKCGVLDVGRRCPHSCAFCYYSFFDGSADQFHYVRRAPWLPAAQCREILDNFVRWGLTHFDCTGGEPSLHPEIVELTDYAHNTLGLKGRMISLGQFLTRKRNAGQTLLEALLEAGLYDFLFSMHTVDAELFKLMTGADIQKMQEVMRILDDKGFSYCVNCVVNEYNYKSLVDTARYLKDRNVRIVNFIVMKIEWGFQKQRGEALKRKARYSDIRPWLSQAIDLLDANGIAVNVRFIPYCALPGYERHVVGFKGLEFDPYEWRNGVRGANDGMPFLKFENEERYLAERPHVIETHPAYNVRFSDKCPDCSLRRICDGVDGDYIDAQGWAEFKPYDGAIVTDLVHFRHGYPGPFTMKQTPCDRDRAA